MRSGQAPSQIPYVRPARFVTVELAGAITGLGENAVRKRIERGLWVEGKQWRRGPDGRQYIDMEGVEAWVLAETA